MKKIWNFDKYVGNTAVIDDVGNTLTYGDLGKESKSLYDSVEKRCLVFCLCKNAIGSLLGYVAFLNNGIVPLMINSGLDVGQINNLLKSYKPMYLWGPKDRKEIYNEFHVVYEAYDYVLVRTDYNADYEINDELALLLTTSGSTGSPKYVRQSYKNIRSNTDSIVDYLNIDSSERAITTLPMNYTYGLSIINTHLDVGATILLTDKGLMQKEFWEFFKEQKATSFGGVPYTYEMLNKLRFYRMDLPYLRTMTQAGGKLSPELHEKFAKFAEETGKKFVVMYGQCEATARMGFLPADKSVEKKGSMGIAIPGGKFKLIDADGEEIKESFVTGELVYEGENVTLGYAENSSDLSKGDERGGALVTGDMAQFDDEGYYYIVGRKKRFLKIYGNRVNLDEMDRMIKDRFEVEVACAGIDDHMYIFVTDDRICDDIKSYITKTTKLNSSAFKVMVLEEIPKNDSGKTRYTELEKYYDI